MDLLENRQSAGKSFLQPCPVKERGRSLDRPRVQTCIRCRVRSVVTGLAGLTRLIDRATDLQAGAARDLVGAALLAV